MKEIEKQIHEAVAVCRCPWGDEYDMSEYMLGYYEKPSRIIDVARNTEDVVFVYVKVWILNPKTVDNGRECYYMYTMSKDGTLLYLEPTLHFDDGENPNGAIFKGRKDTIAEKGEDAWYYSTMDSRFHKCKVGEVPPSMEYAEKHYGLLDWMDDSYLVYPYHDMEEGKDNHRHIQTCFMFSDDFVKKHLN